MTAVVSRRGRRNHGNQLRLHLPVLPYTAHVCGGRDVGMIAVVHTMISRDCRELVDVVIEQRGMPTFPDDPDLEDGLNHCPQCDGRNTVEWMAPGPCPCRGQPMDRSEFVT